MCIFVALLNVWFPKILNGKKFRESMVLLQILFLVIFLIWVSFLVTHLNKFFKTESSVQWQSSRGVLIIKAFLKISQISQENTCVEVSFLIKLQDYNFIRKETHAQVFPLDISKLLRTPFFIDHLPWLLLSVIRNELIKILNCFCYTHVYHSQYLPWEPMAMRSTVEPP